MGGRCCCSRAPSLDVQAECTSGAEHNIFTHAATPLLEQQAWRICSTAPGPSSICISTWQAAATRVTWWAPSNTRSCRPSSCSLPACCWHLTSPILLAVHPDAALWPTEMPPGQAICLKVQLQQGTLQAGTTDELPSPSPRHVALPRKDPDLSHWVSRSCSVAVHQHAGHRVPRVAGRLCRGGLHRPILLPGDLIVVNVLGIKCCLAVGKVEPAGQLLELNLQHRI